MTLDSTAWTTANDIAAARITRSMLIPGHPMSKSALRLKYSADVSAEFAWRFRTDIANWNDPPARFSLEGPFEAGSRGTTVLPGQAPLQWRIREVRPGKWFAIEMELGGAVLTFEWWFEELGEVRTRLTWGVRRRIKEKTFSRR
ncbi:MAG: Polyketide cyclase / dehydrase and lipid transport [Candidatus Solibacter sp.]|nr:Polyketide cyclase / dehydrase and lipid transport [Candidatus Solibacter sp.]